MRFHHSTRRGRHHSAPSHHLHTSSTRWSQLNHCRETNIYFNRRLPVEYPADHQSSYYLTDEPAEPDPIMVLLMNGGGSKPATKECNKETDKEEEVIAAENKKSDLDLETLREKLIAQVQKHPFWSNKAAKRMQIKNVKRRNVYIYELESYCERRDLEWNYEPYRGGLSAGSVTPHRSYELPATTSTIAASNQSSISQPTTPMNHPAAGNNLFVWSNNQTTTQATSCARSPVSRSQSSGIGSPSSSAPPTTASTKSTSQLLVFEPISARLEHLIPSPDFVWSIDVSASRDHHQTRARRQHPTGAPGCVTSELPNSSFVKRCHGCQGRGKLKCNSCHGVGYEVCLSCSGKGSTRSYSSSAAASSGGRGRSCDRYSSGNYDRGDSDQFLGGGSTDGNPRNSRYANGQPSDSSGFGSSLGGGGGGWSAESCSTCHGAGQKRCWVCAGKSYNNCPGCAGLGNLRCFLKLTVSWLNHCEDVIINNSDQIIPKERLRVCSGLLLLDQVEDRLRPLNLTPTTTSTTTTSHDVNHQSQHTSNQQIKPQQQQQKQDETSQICRSEAEQLQLTSKLLLEKHRNSYKNEKFLKQRHKVTQIECHVVKYEWKQRHGQFVIYGEERKVYIGKYPFKSFCNLI